MDMKEILAKCDHTLLKQTARWSEIKKLCDEGIDNGCASVCIPPSYVRDAADYIRDKETMLKICTVIIPRRLRSWRPKMPFLTVQMR